MSEIRENRNEKIYTQQVKGTYNADRYTRATEVVPGTGENRHRRSSKYTGSSAYNPEPVADFFDLFNIGEGEEMLPEIASDATKMHYHILLQNAWEEQQRRGLFDFHTSVTVTGIDETGVTYKDVDGNEAKVEAGTVLLAAGGIPNSDEALKFGMCNGRLFVIGDCNFGHNIMDATRDGFFAAIQI